jgi:hypothetical protein
MTSTPGPEGLPAAGAPQQTVTRPGWTAESASVVVQRSSLPQSLKEAVTRFVQRAGWRPRRSAELARGMLAYFGRQLELGKSPEGLAAQWREAIPAPAFQRLTAANLLQIHALPANVAALIDNVVRATRLWRAEQIDVVQELIAHFQDGLEAGADVDRLIEDFGSVATASQLIRRAKIRNRPIAWHIARRSLQSLGFTLVLVIVWWSWLLIRFQFARPTIVHDYIGTIDAAAQAGPASERAWPLYARALARKSNWTAFLPPLTPTGQLTPEWQGLVRPVDVQRQAGHAPRVWPLDAAGKGAPPGEHGIKREYQFDLTVYSQALEELSDGKHWPAMLQYARMNDQALDLILQGSAKPKLGFVFRDPGNVVWMADADQSANLDKSSRSMLVSVLLPHIQEMRYLEHLLRIEIERARLAGDRDRVIEVLTAELQLARQVNGADGFAISQLVGIAIQDRCTNMIHRILDRQPDFFTDAHLRTLAHRIAAYRDQTDLHVRSGMRRFLDDLAQRFYSDDGHGNGQLTADGCRLLQQCYNIGNEFGPNSNAASDDPGSARLMVEGSLLSGVTVSRAEFKRVTDRYCDLEEAEENLPLWEVPLDDPPASARFLEQTVSTRISRIRFRPLAMLQPLLWSSSDDWNSSRGLRVAGAVARMNCDATLTGLGLELYHRRHGTWPSTLELLCPDLLPSVPIDQFDGRPLKYRLVEQRPILYSVGRNRTDDGGQWAQDEQAAIQQRQGDWRLWSIRAADQ